MSAGRFVKARKFKTRSGGKGLPVTIYGTIRDDDIVLRPLWADRRSMTAVDLGFMPIKKLITGDVPAVSSYRLVSVPIWQATFAAVAEEGQPNPLIAAMLAGEAYGPTLRLQVAIEDYPGIEELNRLVLSSRRRDFEQVADIVFGFEYGLEMADKFGQHVWETAAFIVDEFMIRADFQNYASAQSLGTPVVLEGKEVGTVEVSPKARGLKILSQGKYRV